jgi:hypothetical protein
VLTLSGSGDKSSKTFHVNGDWQIKISCTNSTTLANTDLYILVYPKGASDDGAFIDSLSFQCAKGKKTSDSSDEHQGGDYYLKVLAMSPYTITVLDVA